MEINELTALSPLDGRYSQKCKSLRPYFSEYGLMRARVHIELSWLQFLSSKPEIAELPAFTKDQNVFINDIKNAFSEADARQIKQMENVTHHDMKACEYFIKEYLAQDESLAPYTEFVHFGCTSEDINNLAYASMLKASRDQILLPSLDSLAQALRSIAKKYANTAMLSRTHGQPASPTTFGKEIANFVARLEPQLEQFRQIKIKGKLNGAVGNYNALIVAYPDVDWPAFTNEFIESLGFEVNRYTTQIEPHDYVSEYFNVLAHINTILTDLCRDIWGYMAMRYIQYKLSPGQVGSSTMPHKINPIHFENSEGNLGMANALLTYLSSKLPISRWQRDLSDSTSLRNLGVALGHCLLAYNTLLTGLDRMEVNHKAIASDLASEWAVLGEAIQTVMRRYGLPNPYERLKSLTQGETVDEKTIKNFIDDLEIPQDAKDRLMALTPSGYTGLAHDLATQL